MTSNSHDIDYRVPAGSGWSGLWKIAAVVAVIGLIGTLVFGLGDMHRLGYAYLFGLFTALSFVFGAMFLVLIQFMAVGHWGITCRRIVEAVMAAAPVMALMAVPFVAGVATGAFSLYDEWISIDAHGATYDDQDHGDAASHEDGHSAVGLISGVAKAQHGELPKGHPPIDKRAGDVHPAADKVDGHGDDHGDEAHAHTPQEIALHHHVLEGKVPYLNKTGWIARAVFYFAIWCLIALGYFRLSRRQDETKDFALTNRMQSLSAISLIAFALTVTFAAFDWLMSLEPAWYSTIFGVVIFAGSAVAILALTILIGLSLFNNGLVGNAINHEHFHDLGKLLFGFICFWTYVQFSQWMLIWYAGIPEEATWFHKRWGGGWQYVSLLLIFGHFVAPFVLLISRIQKRALRWLQAMCVWVIVMHVVDIYWFVMPHATEMPHLQPKLVDVSALLLIGGVLMTFVLRLLTKVPLIPVGDPRLARSLHHHQSH